MIGSGQRAATALSTVNASQRRSVSADFAQCRQMPVCTGSPNMLLYTAH